jgi:DNA-binding ferritin-like protein
MEAKPRMLKRPAEKETKTTQSSAAPIKIQPTVNSNTGGSSLDNMVASCGVELMNARNTFHKLHLKVTGEGSYAAHKALNDLYDALPDFADTLIEGYQGAAEKILTCKDVAPRTVDDVADGIAYLREIYGMINKLQGQLPYSEIVNNLDLVKDAINSAKYKLLFLK